MADAGHCASEVVVGLGETQAVEKGDGPRAHGHDVTEDPADAGRGALVGLHRRRVVVTLDADRRGDAVTDVDDATDTRVLESERGRPAALRAERRTDDAEAMRWFRRDYSERGAGCPSSCWTARIR